MKAPPVVGRDAELRALVPGDSFGGRRRLANTRGARRLIDRSNTLKDPDLARRLWTLYEELTDARAPI